MIYAEWILDGKFDNGIFKSWDEFHKATFSPDLKILVVKIIK